MKTNEIETGSVYTNGDKAKDRRVLRFLGHSGCVEWGLERDRLPYGGFDKVRVTSLASFAKWAKEKSN